MNGENTHNSVPLHNGTDGDSYDTSSSDNEEFIPVLRAQRVFEPVMESPTSEQKMNTYHVSYACPVCYSTLPATQEDGSPFVCFYCKQPDICICVECIQCNRRTVCRYSPYQPFCSLACMLDETYIEKARLTEEIEEVRHDNERLRSEIEHLMAGIDELRREFLNSL